MELDTTGWSGEGEFTRTLLDALAACPGVAALRVEDSPASRGDTGYLFISNEIFVSFAERERVETRRLLGLFPRRVRVREPESTLADLERWLAGRDDIGAPDYTDEGMLQYLRTERIVPPYQTRGYKLVEMVRLYVVRPPR
jgi:hypothetical protein